MITTPRLPSPRALRNPARPLAPFVCRLAPPPAPLERPTPCVCRPAPVPAPRPARPPRANRLPHVSAVPLSLPAPPRGSTRTDPPHAPPPWHSDIER